MIEQCSVFDGYNEIFKFNKKSSESEVKIANGKQIKEERKFKNNLSFRQTNTFTFDITRRWAKFRLLAFSSIPMKKEEEIIIDVNLLLTTDTKKKEAKCKVEKDVKLSKDELQVPVSFNCEINNIEFDNTNNNCFGVEIIESETIASIPKDKKLCNPKKVDKLISMGKMQQIIGDKTIPAFNSTSIDTTGSISLGTFSIVGKPLDNIEKEYKFNITLVSGENALCTLPKTNKGVNAKIDCVLDGIIDKNKISIPQTTILNGYDELFTINKISTERKVSCVNGKLKKINKQFERKISFRQISHFKPSEKKVSFTLSVFLLDNMKKGKEINIDVNIKKGKNEFISKTAKCILNEEIKLSSKEKQIASDFNCSVENIENPNTIESLELISSDDIIGIPSNPNMTNPIKVDKLIESGEIIDYTLKENKIVIPPIFKTSSFISLGCKSTGVFKLKGQFDKKVEHFRFNLPLSYPSIDTRCDVPEAKEGEEVELTCKTKSQFSNSKIIIGHSTISKNDSEVISLLPISSDNEISCDNFISVHTKKMEKKYKSPFSFRQTQKFKNDKGKIEFSIFAFKTEQFKNQKDITIKVRLIKNSKLRYLEESSPINIGCSAASLIKDPVEFSCGLKTDNNVEGVLITDSNDMSGIPSNLELSNPSKVDLLIKNGTVKDCNKNCDLPTFSDGKVNTEKCDCGTINLNGKINGKIKDGSIFNLNISPESYGDCNISVNKEVIECYNKEEIEDSKIIIPETVIQEKENKTDLFKLKGIISDSDDISCSINGNLHTDEIRIPSMPSESTESDIISSESTESDTQSSETTDLALSSEKESETTESNTTSSESNTINNGTTNDNNMPGFIKKKNSGLSGGAIAAIVICCSVILITIIALLILAKSCKAGSSNFTTISTIENSSNLDNTVKIKLPSS